MGEKQDAVGLSGFCSELCAVRIRKWIVVPEALEEVKIFYLTGILDDIMIISLGFVNLFVF